MLYWFWVIKKKVGGEGLELGAVTTEGILNSNKHQSSDMTLRDHSPQFFVFFFYLHGTGSSKKIETSFSSIASRRGSLFFCSGFCSAN